MGYVSLMINIPFAVTMKKKKKEHARTYYIGNFRMSWNRARTGPHHSSSVRYNNEVVV